MLSGSIETRDPATARFTARAAGLRTLVFTLLLLAPVLIRDTSGHSLRGWAAVVAFYATVGFTMDAVVQRARARGRAALAGTVPVAAAFLLAHYRVETDLLRLGAAPVTASIVGLGIAVLVFGVSHVGAAVPGNARLAVAAVGTAVVALVATIASDRSPSFRWHVMTHHRLAAVGVHALRGDRVPSVSEVLAVGSAPRATSEIPTGEESREEGAGSVVLVLVDTLRADALSMNGGDPEVMPWLNDLAGRGTAFTNVLANASWTRPSMATYFTGLLPEQAGVREQIDRLPDELETLPESLRGIGYATAAFVTNVHVTESAGFAQGFDEFRELTARHPYVQASGVVEAVESWLTARDRAERQFLYVHFMDPHAPYLNGRATRPWIPRRDRVAYLEELRYLDGWLEELWERLIRVLPRPLRLVVASDHGEAFGEHGSWGHGSTLFREVTWVPLVVVGDGISPSVVTVPLEGRDIYHLVMTLAGSGPVDLAAWAAASARTTRYQSTYKTSRSRFVRAVQPFKQIRMRAIEQDGTLSIWSAFGDAWVAYDVTTDAGQVRPFWPEGMTANRLRESLDTAMGFWVPPETARLSEDELDRLRALGYVR